MTDPNQPTPPPSAADDDEEMLDDDADTPTPQPRAKATAAPGATLVERAWTAQRNLEAKAAGVTRGRIARVLRMARKPEPEEFRQSSIIVLVGIGVIGAFGFFTYLFMQWFLGALGAA